MGAINIEDRGRRAARAGRRSARARALAALGAAAAVAGSMALVATPASAESLTLGTGPMRLGPKMHQSVTMTAAYPTAFSVSAYISVWNTTDATEIARCGTGATTCVASFTNDNPTMKTFVAYVVRNFGFPGQSMILATSNPMSITWSIL